MTVESARKIFLTEHCNYQGAVTESFVGIKNLQNCRVNKIDRTGRAISKCIVCGNKTIGL